MMIFHTSKKAENTVYKKFDFGVAYLIFPKRLMILFLNKVSKDVWWCFILLKRPSVYKTFDFGVAILDSSKGVNPWFWVKIKFRFID